MNRKSHILLLTCLLAGTSMTATAATRKETAARSAAPQEATQNPALLSEKRLRAMSTARLLKLGAAAQNADLESPAFVNGLAALKVASARGDRIATRELAKIIGRHQIALDAQERQSFERRFRYEALQGASSSVLAVAGMYDRGEGVPADVKKGAEWYLWAARVGNRRAMAHIGYAYGTGRGLERDEAAALKWLEQTDPGRHRNTLVEIGWALALGTEGVTDRAAALRFFEKAAQLSPRAAYQVALDLERGTRGLQDREAAGHLIKIAAENGDSAAATHLARLLAGSDKAEDQRQAVQWYSLAAQDKDNAAAGQGLSRLLSLRPTPELLPGIIAGLEKAADAGNDEALLGLAHAYAEGIGVNASSEQAAKLLQRAADAGIPEAKYRLGLMYKSGQGVAMDLSRAIELMSSAQESGFPLAALALSAMKEPSTTSSVPEALRGAEPAAE